MPGRESPAPSGREGANQALRQLRRIFDGSGRRFRDGLRPLNHIGDDGERTWCRHVPSGDSRLKVMTHARTMRFVVLPAFLMLRSTDPENHFRVLRHGLPQHGDEENRSEVGEQELETGNLH